ncbi:MAG: GyrI-like domain-containing protein [Lachnospiraceae bacterium]|nr:GyrI-like domain-containing protein [Lachnospiraceae bacterium]
MKYEVVELKEKTVVGVSAITSNNATDMGEVIVGLWEKLYRDGVSNSIKNKVNQFAIGLYSDYADDKYTVTAGNEVSAAENNGLSVKIIPAGKYAKFSVHGNMVTAVAEAWYKIWKMDLDRSFTGDFEEYLNSDWENADVNIYIALK